MIKFGYQLAYYINNKLQNLNNNYEKKSYDPNYCLFSYEDLEKIEDLVLDYVDNINGLENLNNLKKLVIENKFLSKTNVVYNDEFPYQYNTFHDFTSIEKLENLESLVIMDNMFIKKLDLKNLKKLKNLIVFNAPNLEILENLECLENLENIIICGTNISNPINFEQYLKNTKHCEKNFLDINMYPHLKNYKLNNYNISFCERIGQFDLVTLSQEEVYKMFLKCKDIIRSNNLYEKTVIEQLSFVYNYILTNVKFDYDGLENRYHLIKNNPETLMSMKNDFSMIHSSYNALIKGNSNCEGYVNFMRFILNILGIKSYNIHCKLHKDSTLDTNNHSIIKIKCNDTFGYCDPSLQQLTNDDYFMKSFDEITKTHSLSLFEILNVIGNEEVKLDDNNRRYFK